MRCRTCDYRLWNLTIRHCPECGTPFLPSAYQFVPNSVRFCCPRCAQEYYGTGPQGHLQPAEFNCVKCGSWLRMDDMVLQPTEGVEEAGTVLDEHPWMQRKRCGAVRGWFRTVGLALVNQQRLMNLSPLSDGLGTAFWFATFSGALTTSVAILPLVGLGMIFGGRGAGVELAGGMGLLAAAAGLITAVLILLWGAVAHALLRITGPVAGALGRTYQALCYSTGANAITAVPILGWYLGWIWWLVSAVLMVKHGQRVHGGRAALAVLTLPVLALGTLITLWVLALLPLLVQLNWAQRGGATGTAAADTSTVTEAVMRCAETAGYKGPDHALRLITAELLGAADLIIAESNTDLTDVPVGTNGRTLDDFDDLPEEKQSALAEAAAAALPSNTIAHRLGDFVFTYHQATLNDCPVDLWIVICWPAPDVPATPLPTVWGGQASASLQILPGNVWVGRVDGNVQMIPLSSWPLELQRQNTLRAGAGLPPLPEPATVTHAHPAVAPGK